MADDLDLAGTAWTALIERHRATVEGMRETNRSAIEAAHVNIQAVLAEASRLIEECRGFERRVRAFEVASAALEEAGAALAEEAAALPASLVAGLGHRLVSAASAITAVCEILADNRDMTLARRNAFLDMAIKDSRRLATAVERLVTLARIEGERLAWSRERIDAADIVAQALARVRPVFEEKVVALTVEAPAGRATVAGDRARLVEALGELLTNAARFCEAGRGHTWVRLGVEGEAVAIVVADDGPGIPPERRGLVFAPYLETADTLADEPRGTGIGLALARAIVSHHGGSLTVAAAPEGGAAFTLALPLAASVGEATAEARRGEDFAAPR